VSDSDKQAQTTSNQFPIFVDLLDRTRIWKLTNGFECESFKSQANNALGEAEWRVVFGGEIWKDNSRTQEVNATVTISCSPTGRDPKRRIPTTHVWVRIDGRQSFVLRLLRDQEWNQFPR
jgi:hypothetical protein